MAKSDNGDVYNRLLSSASSDPNNSFMKKVTSRVSGFLPTSLTKWFGESERSRQVIRHWDHEPDDDDDYEGFGRPREGQEVQPDEPPRKRARKSITQTDGTFSGGFTVTSTPLVNSHSDHLNRVQPGPSGFVRARQSHRDAFERTVCPGETEMHLNGDDRSDSGESTSGYSSVPQPNVNKESSSDKESKPEVNTAKVLRKSPTTPARSLFSEQSLTPNRSCMSSRRPSFNASTFGSPSFIDRTLTTNRAINSPFYSGRTMYGGAAAYQRPRTIFPNDDVHKYAAKNSIQIKPVNEKIKSEKNHLSKTAKKILEALEHFSSPIADARKIPTVAQSRQNELSRTRAHHHPPIKPLVVPNVPDLLKMKIKERLQNSTVAARNVAASSKSILNTEYSLRTDDSDKQKYSNKMKSKISIIEPAETVALPEVQLPITTLPKFDFSLPPPAPAVSKSLVTSPITKPIESHVKTPKSTIPFKFSSPISIHNPPKSVVPINNFKFSQPLDAKTSIATSTVTVGFKYTPPVNVAPKKRELLKNNGQNTDISIASAPQLVSGSVMDILGKPEVKNGPIEKPKDDLMEKFKPTSGTWECASCMVRNTPSVMRCVACETLKDPPKKKEINQAFGQFKMPLDKWECGACKLKNDSKETSCVSCKAPKAGVPLSTMPASGFGDKFKPSTDTWECSTCMIRNKANLTKCLACETPKQNKFSVEQSKPAQSTWECASCKVRNIMSVTRCISCETRKDTPKKIDPGFAQFKMPTDKWECGVCLVRNDNKESKCVSCTTPKPGAVNTAPVSGFGDKFKPPSDSWECSACMIRNKMSLDKCMACETPKPGSKADGKPALIMPPETKGGSGFADLIKKQNEQWACSSCLVRNPTCVTACKSCGTSKPGATTLVTSSTAPTFKFGLDKVEPTGFKFGIPATAPSTTPATFSFGVKPTQTTTETKISTPTPTFTFGVKPAAKKQDDVIVIDDEDEKEPEKPKPKEEIKEVSKPPVISAPTSSSVSTAISIFPSVTSSSVTSTSSTSAFTFGSPTATVTPFETKTGNVFGNVSNWPTSTETKPAFSFGAPNVTVTTTSSTSKITFDISKKDEPKTIEPVKTTSTSVFSFGAPAQTQPSLFGATTTAAAPVPAATTSTFTFGTPAPVTTSETKLPSFGSTFSVPQFNFAAGGLPFNPKPSETTTSSSTNITSTTSVFFCGSSPSTFGTAKPTISFGSTGTSKAEVKPFSFSAPTTEPAKAPFSFGETAGSSKTVFNFGAGASGSTELFSFTSKTEKPAVFGSAPDVVTTNASVFGTTVSQTTSAPQNGGFNFSAAIGVTPNFKFGSPATGPSQPAAAFTFGQAGSGTATTGAFTFGSNTTSTSFNPDAKPNFNFTSNFTAQASTPTSAGAPVRKIRKAVRRVQPR